ncbi:hypothetical protein NTHI1209_00744 [Haemophilus influenzae]|uniref:Uncharacterized protein n=1 Tax=Haemophilus influenzae TaxID=727 RepID=A0A158SW97_HAEIF|nr:hypothetical protein NTHI1209_00744 [Haemophilus influenzae]
MILFFTGLISNIINSLCDKVWNYMLFSDFWIV